jgi:hypothetical protein
MMQAPEPAKAQTWLRLFAAFAAAKMIENHFAAAVQPCSTNGNTIAKLRG